LKRRKIIIKQWWHAHNVKNQQSVTPFFNHLKTKIKFYVDNASGKRVLIKMKMIIINKFKVIKNRLFKNGDSSLWKCLLIWNLHVLDAKVILIVLFGVVKHVKIGSGVENAIKEQMRLILIIKQMNTLNIYWYDWFVDLNS